MKGIVTEYQALLNIPFCLTQDRVLNIECVIDTGFIGFLTLPMIAVQEMNLPFIRRMPANLADDSTVFLEAFTVPILWNGEKLEIEVLATGSRPLIGTLLLNGCSLNVEFTEGGLVNIAIL